MSANDLSRIFARHSLSAFVLSQTMAGIMLGGMIAYSQQSLAEEKTIEEVVTIGTCVADRTATEVTVPIDVINTDELMNTGQTELGQTLQSTAPSFNFSRTQVSDASDLFRPTSLCEGLA